MVTLLVVLSIQDSLPLQDNQNKDDCENKYYYSRGSSDNKGIV